MAARYVYAFDEPSSGGRELLGGKGIGLAEMTKMGVPVPAGFTITTDACRAYMSNGKTLPDGVENGPSTIPMSNARRAKSGRSVPSGNALLRQHPRTTRIGGIEGRTAEAWSWAA